MHCNKCDTVNDANARFCRACGAALGAVQPKYVISNALMTGSTCPTCSRRNPSGANFCVYCATQLVSTPQPMQTARASFTSPMVQVNVGGSSAIAYAQPQPMMNYSLSPGNLLLRAIWFFLIGWWLGLIWSIFAWLFCLTLIGLPVGLMMLNAIPTVTTLRHLRMPRYRALTPAPYQHPLPLRAIWFVLIGWWASFLWVLTAWGLATTIILMPIAFWMYDRVPTITTLAAEQ